MKYYGEVKFLLGGVVAIATAAVALNQSAMDSKFEGIHKDLAADVKSCQAAISLQLNEKFAEQAAISLQLNEKLTELMAEMAAGTDKTQAEMARLRAEVSDLKKTVEELTV